MSEQYPRSGQGNTSEYIMSGLPFVTASNIVSGAVNDVNFPFVTKEFTLRNTSNNFISIGFTRAGTLGTNRMTLPPSGSFAGGLRIKTLWIANYDAVAGTTGSYELIAALTLLDTATFPVLTGALPTTDPTSMLPVLMYPGLG